MKRSVYISYSEIDRKIAEQICSFLEKKDVECFLRHRVIPGNEQDNLMFAESAIDESCCIIIVKSKDWQKAKDVAVVKRCADKCIVFALDDTLENAPAFTPHKTINAANHPEKMFGHLLSDVKTFTGTTHKKHSIAITALAIGGFFIILILAFFLNKGNMENEEEQAYPEYEDISQKDFLEKELQARQSDVIQKDLPFGKAVYGINEQEWDQCMKLMTKETGKPLDNKNENDIEVPRNIHAVEVDTTKGLKITLEPFFNENGSLFVLHTTIERKTGLNQNLRPLLDEVLTEILGVNDKYADYKKWHVLEDGQLSSFYALMKDNEIVNVRSGSSYTVAVDYINVPCIPKETFEHEYLTFQFNQRNIR